ncbi:hypothetical protein [Dechloromonas sp. A34]|uniref:hypothetical protein n=1 Tax=Dechloromonas sp. A34 TaxID=447588 RepID=UPI002B05AF11|nr:hypothetical protein [Dechloromonas sp. A34]
MVARIHGDHRPDRAARSHGPHPPDAGRGPGRRASATLLRDIPLRLGVVVGICAGIAAGFAAEHWEHRRK